MAIRWTVILWLLAFPSLALAKVPKYLPVGAKILSGEEIGQLLVGATMLGPIYTDNAPVTTTYLANGLFRRGYNGIVHSVIEGKYRIAEGGVCEEYRGQQICTYIARSMDRQPIIAWPPRDQGSKWIWAPFEVVRRSSTK